MKNIIKKHCLQSKNVNNSNNEYSNKTNLNVNHFLVFIFIIFSFSNYLLAEKEVGGEKLLNFSLEELMNISVKTGNITGLVMSKTPVSITTITSNDLAVTPARNLYDILEVYVPGAISYQHWDSPILGMRGIVTDRNYKYLLLVNGRNMNLKAHSGATSELELWDLSDIEKIDVIRGPGSVTYGPGAVAGIINIITKSPNSYNGIQSSVNYVYPYNSKGISADYFGDFGTNSFYLHGSVQSTQGYQNPKVYSNQPNHKYGYFGSDISEFSPIDYFSDYDNLPNIKLHADFSFSNNWDLSLRFTRQGETQNPANPKFQLQTGLDSLGLPTLSQPVNFLQTKDQHISLNLTNESEIGDLFSLSSLVSISSEDYIRNTNWPRHFASPTPLDTIKIFGDLNNIWNHDYDFSESSIMGHFIANKDLTDNLKLAAGTELSLNYWGPGWGNSRKTFRLGDNYDIISGTDSDIYGSTYPYTGVPLGKGYFVGNGWSTFTYSFLYELLWEPNPLLSIMFSGRSDKDTYSKLLFSPRLSFISEIHPNQTLKLTYQSSQRMNTAAQLLIQHHSGTTTEPETLSGIEFMYSGLLSDNISINSSLFYNNLDVISWSQPDRTTKPTGNLKIAGIELEAHLLLDNLELSVNHTYTKQLEWKLNDGVSYSGISYSDFLTKFGNTVFSSFGNDLNNWSNNTTKLICNFKLFDDKLQLHLDTRIFWKFEGALDGIKMLENALNPANTDYEALKELIKVVKDQNMYQTDFRMNFSALYNINEHFNVSLFVMNLIGSGNNKRYTYDAGYRDSENYFRNTFIEEPRTFGLKLDYKY